MPQIASFDQSNHPVAAPGGTLTAAASGSVAGTIIPGAGAGVGSTVALATGEVASDSVGVFNLTAAGTPAAGVIATVNLAQPFAAQNIPAYYCNVVDTTATAAIAADVLPVVASGQISALNIIGPALTAAHVYEIGYGTLGN